MVTDALLWLILAGGIGFMVVGCILTGRPRQQAANEFPARYRRAV